jgi:hypothetical protein
MNETLLCMYSLKHLRDKFPLFLLLFLSLVSCEEDPTEDDAVNANSISQGMEISPSTRLKSEFPPATQDPLAPSIKADEDTLYLIAGTYNNIYVDIVSGEAEGFNVKVDGSNDYLKVTGNRAFTEDAGLGAVGFAISLDADISLGPATLLYSVYDGDNRVSNIVERAIIISGLPGKNSEFISGSWSTIREIWGTEPGTEIIEMGVADENEFTTALDCVSEADKPVTWLQVARVDYKHYSFSSDGKVGVEIDDYYQTLDLPASKVSCSIEYTVNERIDSYDGVWSYYSDAKRLIIRTKTVGVANVDKREYRVSLADGVLTLTGIGGDVPVTHLLEKL